MSETSRLHLESARGFRDAWLASDPAMGPIVDQWKGFLSHLPGDDFYTPWQPQPTRRAAKQEIDEFIERLDELYNDDPILATKLAAYCFTVIHPRSDQRDDLDACFIAFLEAGQPSLEAQIEVAVLFYRCWYPHRQHLAASQFGPGLEKLYARLVGDDPDFVVRSIRETWPGHPETSSVLGFNWKPGDYETTHALARALVAHYPSYSKALLRGLGTPWRSLADRQGTPVGQSAADALHQRFLLELAELEAAVPAADAREGFWVADSLVVGGDVTAEYWRTAVAALFRHAQAIADPNVKGRGIATVAVHATPGSAEAGEALHAYGAWADDVQGVDPADWRSVDNAVKTRALAINIARGGSRVFRNPAVAADPRHAIVGAAEHALTVILDWLAERDSPFLLNGMHTAVENVPDEAIAMRMAERLESRFASHARRHPDDAGNVLSLIATFSKCRYEAGEAYKPALLRRLFDRLLPELREISPERADRALETLKFDPF